MAMSKNEVKSMAMNTDNKEGKAPAKQSPQGSGASEGGKQRQAEKEIRRKQYRILQAAITCVMIVSIVMYLVTAQKCLVFGHTWQAATCETPRTCNVCGDVDGIPLEHIWQAATCETSQTCKVCGTVEGAAFGHSWQAETCETPRVCRTCGASDGAPAGHIWWAATCETGQTCKVCGAVEGTALGHSWLDATYDSPAVCTRCGKTEGKALGYPLTWYSYESTSNQEGSHSDVDIGTWKDTRGTAYDHAIKFWVMERPGMNDTEYIEYVLSRSYSELSLTMAAEQGSAPNTSSKILVYADGVVIYESVWIGNDTLPVEKMLDITGCHRIRIVCTTDSNNSCYCIVSALLYP